MTDPLSPNRILTVAGKAYLLDGSFATLRKVQEHFEKDIVQVLISVMDMHLDDIADLIGIGCGQPDKADEIGQAILDEVGPLTRNYVSFKTSLTAWLAVAISPKAEREKKRAEAETLLAKLGSPSPGESTENFA